jgi:hypothetical protein
MWKLFSWKPGVQRRAVLGLLGALAIGCCVYNVAHFEFKPLDSPGTLHPILWPLYAAFVKHFTSREVAAEAWAKWCFVAFLPPVALALLNHCAAWGALAGRGRTSRILRSRGLLFFSIALCLLVCRYPLLLGGHFNPDESDLTTSAAKLLIDPVYYRAVDGNTSGPLNAYPIVLPMLAGFSPDYASTRIVGLILIFLSIYVLYQALRQIGDDGLARIALLPAIGFFGFVVHPEFVCYGTEHGPMLLVALAVYACARTIRDPQCYAGPLAGLGALVAAAFFAKMQAVPIVGAAALTAVACVYRSGRGGRFWRPFLCLAAGFAPLPVLNAVVCVATGVWGDFWNAYLVANWSYTRVRPSFLSELGRLADFIADTREFQVLTLAFLAVLAASLYQTLRKRRAGGSALRRECVALTEIGGVSAAVVGAFFYLRQKGSAADHNHWCTIAFLAAVAAVAFLTARWRAGGSRVGWFGGVAGASLLGAMVSLSAPQNTFYHHLLLLVIPLCTAMGWLLMRHSIDPTNAGTARDAGQLQGRTRYAFPLVFTGLIVGGAWGSVPMLHHNFDAASFHIADPEGRPIRSLTRPGSAIVVWGWRPENYLDSGRLPAGRDTNMGHLFLYGRQTNDWYRARFLRDLRRRPADLLVDALDVSCCNLNDRSLYGFGTIPEIGEYIRSYYVLVAEQYGERFYLRRELAGGAGQR